MFRDIGVDVWVTAYFACLTSRIREVLEPDMFQLKQGRRQRGGAPSSTRCSGHRMTWVTERTGQGYARGDLVRLRERRDCENEPPTRIDMDGPVSAFTGRSRGQSFFRFPCAGVS